MAENISEEILKRQKESIDEVLQARNLNRPTRVTLESLGTLMLYIEVQNARINNLKKDIEELRGFSLGYWVSKNKVSAGFIFTVALILNSFWNWSGLRHEWLEPLLKMLGINIIVP